MVSQFTLRNLAIKVQKCMATGRDWFLERTPGKLSLQLKHPETRGVVKAKTALKDFTDSL
jgi:hypothetical protein